MCWGFVVWFVSGAGSKHISSGQWDVKKQQQSRDKDPLTCPRLEPLGDGRMPIDLSELSKRHVHVARITQRWPLSDPFLPSALTARRCAHLPTRLLTRSTCQRQDRCPWYHHHSPPLLQARTAFQRLCCHPDQTRWPPPSCSSSSTVQTYATWWRPGGINQVGYTDGACSWECALTGKMFYSAVFLGCKFMSTARVYLAY